MEQRESAKCFVPRRLSAISNPWRNRGMLSLAGPWVLGRKRILFFILVRLFVVENLVTKPRPDLRL